MKLNIDNNNNNICNIKTHFYNVPFHNIINNNNHYHQIISPKVFIE